MTKFASYLFSALVALLLSGRAPAAEPTPNILFIFTDDHCQQAMSCYGSNRIQTPHMDRIAKEGMLFNRCYVTNAICGPSRAVIQTGKYSHLNGFLHNGNRFDGNQQTFQKILQKVGYETAVIGKWHLGTHMPPQGFDHYDVLIGQGPYYNPPMLTSVGSTDGNSVRRPHTGYTTHIITDKALTWLQEDRDENKPFMLMYQHKAPHRDWMPGPDYLTLYDDVEIPEPETLFDDYKGRTRGAAEQTMSIARDLNPNDLKLTKPGGLTPEQLAKWEAAYGPKNKAFHEANLEGDDLVRWKYQRYAKDYLRCVKAVDDDIGKVLAYLDESGLAKNTVVIYSSDQGWYLGEHGWYDKRWMYEESLLMPLLVRWAGVVKPGSTNDDIVSNLDFAETFLDIAGAAIPEDMQGRSLVPILKGETPDDWRTSFYYHYYEGARAVHSVPKHYGVTDGRYKLIHIYENEDWEMFDLKTDPNELQSVYDNPEYKEQRQRLEAELARLRTEFKVPAEDPAPAPPKKAAPKKPGNKVPK